jgi:hypothetical protein
MHELSRAIYSRPFYGTHTNGCHLAIAVPRAQIQNEIKDIIQQQDEYQTTDWKTLAA